MSSDRDLLKIVVQHLGESPSVTSASTGEVTVGDADHARVTIIYSDGLELVVFTGRDFSKKEYAKRQALRSQQAKGEKT